MDPFDDFDEDSPPRDPRVSLQSSSSAACVSDVTPIDVTSHDETVIVDDDKADKTKDDDNTHKTKDDDKTHKAHKTKDDDKTQQLPKRYRRSRGPSPDRLGALLKKKISVEAEVETP